MFRNENEFKRLIEQLKIEYPSNTAHESELRSLSMKAFSESRPTRLKIKLKQGWEAIMNSKVTRYAAVIIILLVASYTIGVFNDGPNSTATRDSAVVTSESSSEVEGVTPVFLKKFNEVKELYDGDDIKAIVGLLESDDMVVRMIAAEFLGKTSDIEVAKVLEKLSGEQSLSQLAEKFTEAAANIRSNIANPEQGGDSVEDKGAVDSNGVSLVAPEAEKGFFLIKVIDKKTKKPIGNLNICAQIDGGLEYYKTGNDWFCKVKLTKPEFGYFSVGVQADGYASVRFVKDIDNKDYVVPLEYTIEMEKGVWIGGYVENEDGQRLTGCKVRVKCERKNTEIDRAYTDTEAIVDANGVWKCNMVPAKFDYLELTGDHSDYVDLVNSIEPGSEGHKLVSALKYTVEVEKGILIGGVIKNKEGVGVGGVDVNIRCSQVDDNDRWHEIAKGSVITDGEGNWQFGKIPNVELRQVEIKADHSDYVSNSDWVEYHSGEFKLLAAKKFVTTITRGKVIAGVVRDVDGRAIEGAKVMFGTERYNRDEFVEIKTDSAGRFSNDKVKVNKYNMQNIQPGQVAVTVVKKGYAPEMMVVSPSAEQEELEFVLDGGYTITGRVVDVNGKGIEDVSVNVDEWRGFRTFEWGDKTDSQGRFTWNDAPSDIVQFNFGKSGYASNRNEEISYKRDGEIVLYRPLKVRGRVSDAETGEAVKDFDITHGIKWQHSSDNITYQRHSKKIISDPNGNYEWVFLNDYPGHVLKVEALGYATVISRIFKVEEGVVEYDFKVSKADSIEMAVKFPDGSIAANVDVVVAGAGEYANFQEGYFNNNGNNTVISTDDEGRLNLANSLTNFSVIIVHDKGFLLVQSGELEGLQELKLEKWGGIRGYVYRGEKPVDQQSIRVYRNFGYNPNENNYARINYSLTAVTDSNGFFEVGKVIPAERVQCSWIKKDGRTNRHLMNEHVEVLPGEVSEVEFLLAGRAVVGRLIIPDDIKGQWSSQMSYFNITSKSNNMQGIYEKIRRKYYPENYDDMTVREKIQWMEDLPKSEKCQEYVKEIQEEMQGKEPRYINAVIDGEGNLKADGVVAGQWALNGRMVSLGVTNNRYTTLAKVELEFEVPESEQLYSYEAFDLGEIEVKALDEGLEKLAVGDMCPEFEVETADGDKVKSEGFRGKYLVLNYVTFANWRQEHVKLLNDIYAQYNSDDIEMLTVTYFNSFTQIKKLEEEMNIDWPVFYIQEDGFNSKSSKLYDISKSFGCIDSMDGWFIVGPEGEILKAYVEFDELENALEEVFVGP